MFIKPGRVDEVELLEGYGGNKFTSRREGLFLKLC